MEILQLLGTTTLIMSSIIFLAYVNKKFELGLNDLSFSMSDNSINEKLVKSVLLQKDEEIIALKRRVQVLEKIIVDPAEQLKREIDNL